jgi:hypothetical protein
VFFLSTLKTVEWITLTLQTVTSKHRNLRRVYTSVLYDASLFNPNVRIEKAIGELSYNQWLGLDRLLTQLQDSHSIHPTICYDGSVQRKEEMYKNMRYLLPETTEKWAADFEGLREMEHYVYDIGR